MFKPLEGLAPRVTVSLIVEGRTVLATDGEMLATALLRTGLQRFRETPVSGAPRAPWCLMGACFECLVEVDGQANVQACMTPVKAGMVVALQHGARGLSHQP